MKIIKPGTPPDKWWVGVDLSCDACGCVFQIEDDDYVSEDFITHQAGHSPYVGGITVECPTCGMPVSRMHRKQ